MDSHSPMKHRLELLERSVYAIQAQNRVLEYRLQYLEDRSRAIPGTQHKTEELPVQFSSQAQAQTQTPKGSLNPHAYSFEIRPFSLATESQGISTPELQKQPSLSLLDEPSVLNTPILIPAIKERPEPVLMSSQKQPSVPEQKKRGSTVVSWDGTVAWKLMRLFKDKDEEKKAILHVMQDSSLNLEDEWIFQYGLRYLPKAGDIDIYRTIRIEHLPENTRLDKVLAEVCYGTVISADLLNTFPITGYHTARVVFLHQQSASKFCKYAKKGVTIQGVQARVALERTATYPIGASLQEEISKHGCTRCVSITGVTERLLACIEDTIADSYLRDCVENYSKQYADIMDRETDDIKVCVRFHSMRAASFAYKTFQQMLSPNRCLVKYEEDPCNRNPIK